MSGDCETYRLREDDVFKLLACSTHIGASNVNFQMEQYVWKRKTDGVYVINVRRTWEKLVLAARAIAAIENPADVCVISARPYAQRAILKFAYHIGATPIAGRFTPGTFTNQIQKAFKEPRLLVVTDPRVDHQAITEASYVNIPVISFCNTDSPAKFIDIAIPCNNKGQKSVGLMWWMLAREVLTIRGDISRATGFELEGKEIMPDLYFYRDPEDAEKEEQAERGLADADVPAPVIPDDQWGQQIEPPAQVGLPPALAADFQIQAPVITDWAMETQQYSAQQAQAAAATAGQTTTGAQEWGGPSATNWQ